MAHAGSPTETRFALVLVLLLAATHALADVSSGDSGAVRSPSSDSLPTTETEALELGAVAMESDYLSAEFEAARTKLVRASQACEAIPCSVRVRARLLRDLATIEIVGLGLSESGRAHLAAALALEPKLELDPDLATAELRRVFSELGGGDANRAPEPVEPSTPPPEPTRAVPKGGEQRRYMAVEVCPPGFPGCDSGEKAGKWCSKDSDCEAGSLCEAASCVARPVKRNGLSFGFQLDLLLVQSQDNVCSGGHDWACFDGSSEESFYARRPFDGVEDGNEIVGGLHPGTRRLLVGYDRVLGDRVALGLRAGWAFGGGPRAPGGRAFVPFHAEGRLAYWFGSAPLAQPGLHPYVLAGGGVAQVDTKLEVTVFDAVGPGVGGRGDRRKVDAWLKTGTGFAQLGTGVLVALSPGQGPVAEVKAMQMIGVTSFNTALLMGYQVGL